MMCPSKCECVLRNSVYIRMTLDTDSVYTGRGLRANLLSLLWDRKTCLLLRALNTGLSWQLDQLAREQNGSPSTSISFSFL